MAETRVLQRALGVTLVEVAIRDEGGAMVDGGYLVRGPCRELDFTGVSRDIAEARFLVAVAFARTSLRTEPMRQVPRLTSRPLSPTPTIELGVAAGNSVHLQAAPAALQNRVAT
jgi:hypothetical protein